MCRFMIWTILCWKSQRGPGTRLGSMKLLIICGIKHSGKTSIGMAVAEHYGVPFYDLDNLVLEVAAGTWNTVREIWQELGKEEFMRLEAGAASRFVQQILPLYDFSILSLGGGTIENTNAMAFLKNTGRVIYLRADARILYRRVMQKNGRPPFLSEDHPWEDFQSLYSRRDNLYFQIADIVHNVDNSPKAVNAQRLITKLEADYVR